MLSPGAIRLLNLGPTGWARTQSVYRATAELMPAGAAGAVVFCQSLRPYLTHGAQGSAAETFDLEECERLGLPVARRPFPGEAEYCDINQLLFQWILPEGTPYAPGASSRIAAGVAAALRPFGVRADYEGSDFMVNGARLGTLAGGRYGAALVILGCLYFAYDPAPLAQTLRAPRAENVTSLWSEASRPVSPDMAGAALVESFAHELGRPIERDTPRVPETRMARRIERGLLGIEGDGPASVDGADGDAVSAGDRE